MTKYDMTVGTTFQTNRSGKIEIMEYKNAHEVVVQFLDSGNLKTVRAHNIRTGNVFDRDDLAPASVAVGTVHPTTNHGNVEVIEYNGVHDVKIRFLETGEERSVLAKSLRLGYVKPF